MIKTTLRVFFKILLILIAIVIVAILIYISPWIYRRIAVYPKLEKARTELRAQHQTPPQHIPLNHYKGILHMHSYWSHDSRGVLKEIVPAAKEAGMDFLFFSDHPHGKLDTFPRSFNGMYDGILMVAGTETSQGLMVNPMDTVVLDWNKPQAEVLKEVVDMGGLALYCHTEDPHEWDDPNYQAMEIYNLHTDLLDEEGSILPLITNFAINGKKYGHWAMREIFDEQTDIMANWEKLNTVRRITGIGAADAHNNQNVRARYTEDGKVEWIGPNADLIATVEPGWKEKLLLREPDEAGWAFRFETDSYYNSFNHVNTHVFCDSLDAHNIKDHLVAGHAFVAFENLADARGFQYFATGKDGEVNAILGDSIAVNEVHELKAVSPLPVTFKLFRNGELVETYGESREYSFAPGNQPGNYRVEAHVRLQKETVQWVITNIIYVHEEGA